MDEFEERGTETTDWHETFDDVVKTTISHALLCPFCNRQLAVNVTLTSSDCHRVKVDRIFEKEEVVYNNILEKILRHGSEITVTNREQRGTTDEYTIAEYTPSIEFRGRISASAVRGEESLTDACWYDQCNETVELTVSGVDTVVINEGEHGECPDTWAGPEEEAERGQELYKNLADLLTREERNKDELRVLVDSAHEARTTYGMDSEFVPLEVKSVTLEDKQKTYSRYGFGG